MEKHPGIIEGGVIRKDGSTTPANAGDVLAIVLERFTEAGILILPRFRAIAGKLTKECLDAGVPPELLVRAVAISFKRAEPQNLHFIVQDLILAQAGTRMTRRDYERALQDEIEIGGLR